MTHKNIVCHYLRTVSSKKDLQSAKQTIFLEDKDLTLNIIFPVYNEEKRIYDGISQTVKYLNCNGKINFTITIVDNASIDKTEEIAKNLCCQFDCVRYIRISEKGVGAAFRAGVEKNNCDIVGYMDIDLSTPLEYIPVMTNFFLTDESVQMVNASRHAKTSVTIGRKWYRNITSSGLVVILKIVFGMKASDAICGFKFFRRECAEKLIGLAGTDTNGWFYIIELLLRAELCGEKIVELPVRWYDDSKNTTVRTFKIILEYLQHIFDLKKKFRAEVK